MDYGNYSDWANQQLKSGQSPQAVQASVQQAQQQPKQSGNFLTHLIPTATSILGGIGGALIPGLGETGVGEIAGYGGGQAVGQGLENVLEGKPWSQDVAKAGVEGAAFGGVGKVLGGVTEGLGKVLSSKGSSMLENLSTSQTQAAEKLAQMSKQKATQLNFAGVTPETNEANMLKNNQAFMDQMGLPSHSPHVMDATGQAFYDTLGAERTAAQDSVGTAQTKGLLENVSKAFGVNRGEGRVLPTDISSTPFDDIFNTWANRADVGVKDVATGQLRKPTINDFMNNNIPPSQLQKLREEIGTSQKSYQDLAERTSSPNAMQQAKNTSSILSQVNKSMEPLVNHQAANDAIAARTLSPTERAGYIKDYGDKLGNFLADKIDNANTVQDLTGQLKTGVQMKNISKEAIADLQNTASKNAGARMEASDAGYGGIAEPGNLTPPEENLFQHAVNAVKVAAGGGGKISKAMQLADIGAKTKIAPKALEQTGSLLSRIGKIIPPTTVGAGSLIAAGAQQGAGGAPMNQQQSMQQGMPDQQNQLASLYSNLLAQEQASPINFASSLGPVLQALGPMVQKQGIASGLAQNLGQAYQGAGGAQGPLMGALSQLSGVIPGTPANVYGRQQQATSGLLAQLLGINPQQAGMLTPQLMATPGSAGAGLSNVQNLIGAYGQ